MLHYTNHQATQFLVACGVTAMLVMLEQRLEAWTIVEVVAVDRCWIALGQETFTKIVGKVQLLVVPAFYSLVIIRNLAVTYHKTF